MPEEEKTDDQNQEDAAGSETPEVSESNPTEGLDDTAGATGGATWAETEGIAESSGEETPELPDFSNLASWGFDS